MQHILYTPKTSVRTVRPSPRNCPLLIFWAVHDISRTFEFLTPQTPPLRPPWSGSIFVGSNDSRINPHMRAKFGCSQADMSKKRGGTDRQTDTHTHTCRGCEVRTCDFAPRTEDPIKTPIKTKLFKIFELQKWI